MTDLSDLEKRMLECNKRCPDHHTTVENMKDLRKCFTGIKNRLDKLSNKTSWMIGVLFLAGLFAGYGLNSIHELELNARHQAGKNQTFQTDSIHVSNLEVSQKNTEILLAQIQNDIRYIKRDIIEIKKTVNRRD